MVAVTNSDLKRLEDLIILGQKAIESSLGEIKADIKALEAGQTELIKEIQALEMGQIEIKGDIRTLEATLGGMSERTRAVEISTGKIPELAEKVGEIKHWRQIGIIALTALISSTLTLVLRARSLKP
jgi:chromosome segregation ATPase